MTRVCIILLFAGCLVALGAETSEAHTSSAEPAGLYDFDKTSTNTNYLWTKALILRWRIVALRGRTDPGSRNELVRAEATLIRLETRLDVLRGIRGGLPHLANRVADRIRFREHAYDHLIIGAACSEGLNPALLKAVIRAESAFDPRARSHAGALGLCQLMPQNIRRLGVRDPFDPEQNIRAGARMLAELLARHGSVRVALVAWNAGTKYAKGDKPLPRETESFLRVVLKWFRVYKRELPERTPPETRQDE